MVQNAGSEISDVKNVVFRSKYPEYLVGLHTQRRHNSLVKWCQNITLLPRMKCPIKYKKRISSEFPQSVKNIEYFFYLQLRFLQHYSKN